jgi:hypothetical protein
MRLSVQISASGIFRSPPLPNFLIHNSTFILSAYPPFALLDPYIRTKPRKHWGLLRSDPYHDPYRRLFDPYQTPKSRHFVPPSCSPTGAPICPASFASVPLTKSPPGRFTTPTGSESIAVLRELVDPVVFVAKELVHSSLHNLADSASNRPSNLLIDSNVMPVETSGASADHRGTRLAKDYKFIVHILADQF